VRESDFELDELQALLDRSAEASGAHLRSAFDQSNRLTARALCDALPGIFELHLAVLSGAGAPLVAPLDGILFRGKVWIGLPDGALRARLVRRDPRVSASYNAPSVAFIVHGTAREVSADDPLLDDYSEHALGLYAEQFGDAWLAWRKAQARPPDSLEFTGYIEPRVMFAKG
jgi:hypothetical protein